MKKILLPTAFVMFLFVGSMACIGNPNGVSISFAPESIGTENASKICQIENTCEQKNHSVLYETEEGLAVTAGKPKEKESFLVNIEIPVDEQGNKTFNFTNWEGVYERELKKLSEQKILNLTEGEIKKIGNSTISAGAILSYFPGDSLEGTFAQTNSALSQARTNEYCSGPVVKESEMPVQNPQGSAGSSGSEEVSAPAPTEKWEEPGSSDEAVPSVKPPGSSENVKEPAKTFSLLNYWWSLPLILSVLLVVFLVFRVQIGGQEHEMTPLDMSVLSAQRRLDMMKSLSKKNKTLTDLSKEEGISLPTAKEHLEKLEKSGFVKKIDTGHKWKYYELTRKGKRVLNSTEEDNT